jgi:hypothetical protein
MTEKQEDQMGTKPTHKVFFVQEITKVGDANDNKPFWRQIGVAWEHKSGKGYSMKLDLVPADFSAGELVVLEATEKPEELAKVA